MISKEDILIVCGSYKGEQFVHKLNLPVTDNVLIIEDGMDMLKRALLRRFEKKP